MRTYEALYIIQPEAGDDEIQTIDEGVKKLITDNGGSVVRSEIWGKRRLAYEVKGFNDGVYVLVRYQATPEIIQKLETHFRLADAIIRHLVVNFDEKTLRLEDEQQKRNEAQRAHIDRDSSDRDDDPRERRFGRRSEREAGSSAADRESNEESRERTEAKT